MIRTYKRKLKLNKAQEQRILSWLGVCRLVYNMGLEISETSYKVLGKRTHKYELMKQITSIRDIDWVADVPNNTLCDVIKRLDKAYSTFFKTYKIGGGLPRFASKRTYRSISFRQNIYVKDNAVKVTKLGWLKTFKDEPITGIPKNVHITAEPTGFFVCIQCDDAQKRFDSENQAIGLDMGISHFCIDSNGNFISNPKHFKKYERQLRIENRSLTRKKKGSNRWRKQAKRLSLLHHKIGNVRRDFLHKESTKIAKANSTVYLEDLNIKGMAKNRNLSKKILDCGWGMFRTMLEYKTNVVKINPKYTSQTCNECGGVDSKNRISQSEFCCTACGHVSNADVNAAKNILSKGIAFDRQRGSLERA